jgi:ribosomal protein L40E
MNNYKTHSEKTQPQADLKTFKLSYFQHKRDTVPQVVERSWDELVGEFEQPYIRADKDGELFAPVVFEPAKRLKENVREISILSLDIDHGAPELPTLKAQLDALDASYFIYSTHSHLRKTDKNPNAERRYRVAIPLACPIPAKDFPALWAYAKQKTGLPLDESAKDASRMFYTPVIATHDAPFVFDEKEGEFLNWKKLPLDSFAKDGPYNASGDSQQKRDTLVFEFHEDRHAELCRRVETQARSTGRGTCEMKCPSHKGKGDSSLFYDPKTEVVACIRKPNPCSYFDICAAFGLPNGRLPSRESNNNVNNVNNVVEVEREIGYPKLSNAVFFGLAGELVKLIAPHTEADNAALLVQFLSGFGNLIGHGAHFRVGADAHYTKLNTVLVGATAAGRKGLSWGEVQRVLVRVDESFKSCIHGGLSSGEGLIHTVRDSQFKKTPIREKGRIVDYQDEMYDEGTSEKRAFVVESEFARVLKVSQREGNTLSQVIRDAWDKDFLQIKTKQAVAASNAHISIVGHITKEELLRTLADSDLTNGFANRFVWVCSRRSKYLPSGGYLSDLDINVLVTKINRAAEFAKTAGEIKRDEEADVLWCEVYRRLSDGHAGLLGSVTSRATAQVLRIACLYSLLDCSNVIRIEHLTAALALWQYCEDSARYIFGAQTGNRIADEIFTELNKRKDGMSKNDIREHFQQNRSAAEINIALELLLDLGKIDSYKEKTATRPKEIFIVLSNVINVINVISQNTTPETEETSEPSVLSPEKGSRGAPPDSPSAEETLKSEERETTPHFSNAGEKVAEDFYACMHCGADIPLTGETCPKCKKTQLPTF